MRPACPRSRTVPCYPGKGDNPDHRAALCQTARTGFPPVLHFVPAYRMSGALRTLRAPALRTFCGLHVPKSRMFCGLCDSIRRTAGLSHSRIRCRCDYRSLIEVRAKKWNSFYDLHYDFAITICSESRQVPALSAFVQPAFPFHSCASSYLRFFMIRVRM